MGSKAGFSGGKLIIDGGCGIGSWKLREGEVFKGVCALNRNPSKAAGKLSSQPNMDKYCAAFTSVTHQLMMLQLEGPQQNVCKYRSSGIFSLLRIFLCEGPMKACFSLVKKWLLYLSVLVSPLQSLLHCAVVICM